MAEFESEEAVRLRQKASYLLKSPSNTTPPANIEHKSSYFHTKSLAEMVNEDPISLQNQSCVIREEIVQTPYGEQLVYSSLARLPTFSIGLSSTRGEAPLQAPLRQSSVDPKDKSLPRYFQMPELGARVFVGDRGGFDTVACQLFNEPYPTFEFHLHSENAAIRSLYEDDHPGGLSGWLGAQPAEFWRSKDYSEVILSGTELFVDQTHRGATTVGNLGGKSSRVFGSSSNYKDCTSDETIVEQPGDPVPGVYCRWADEWESIEDPVLRRSTKGSYLEKPKFMKKDDIYPKYDPSKGKYVLQLTRFDDFVILGNAHLYWFLLHHEVIDIVRKNASETADAIAAKVVKGAIGNIWLLFPYPIIAIVIFLDHKEILLREHQKKRKVLRDDKTIPELKEEEKIITLKEEEKALEMKDKKGIRIDEDHKDLVDELMSNANVSEPEHVPQTSEGSLEEIYELGMKSASISSNLTSAKVQDDSQASSSVAFIEDDDSKSEDVKISCHITKWIIYGDLRQRTLLCFFNMEEKQYEFYFEDHESMATIIGLGMPHSKVVLECGSLRVTVVEILEEDWDVVWAYSNVIPCSILEAGYVLKQEQFPDILYRIANVINTVNIVSKANNGGVQGDNEKGKAQGNADDNKGKGKAQDHDDHGNIGHPDGGSNGPSDDNDNKERKEEDGNKEKKKDGRDQNDGKSSKDCKEVQAIVHLRLLAGGVLEDKEKKKELGEVYEEEGEGKKKELGEICEEEGEGKKKELGEICEEEVEEKKKKREASKGVAKKKKSIFKALRNALTRDPIGNVSVENQQEKTTTEEVENGVVGNLLERTTTEGVEDGDVDENLQKQLEKQIHSQMKFTFTIKEEAGGPLKTIQATICPITFQIPSTNKENYLQRRRFGWFHEELQVAFGVVNIQVADLDADSCKVLDSSEVEEVSSQGNSKGTARTSTNAYKGKIGVKYVVVASGEYNRTNGSEAMTTNEVLNSWKTNKRCTKGGFSISDCIDLNSKQLKYSYFPPSPFTEEEFEVIGEDDRLNMYHLNPICQSQQVSCEGIWLPYDSEKLEAYKLEASRELGMTRSYNMELGIGEEKRRKGVRKVGKNLPLCFSQKLEKVVYLNHAMSHLTSSTTGVYHLKEIEDPSNPSSTILTQAQYKEEPKWPKNNPLVDVKQKRNI